MEISGKILREVEFRDRLRGYDTDEVDEFLEKVAVAVDEMRAEVASAQERVREAERRSSETPIQDDDSIRRTLVLAQRTADLAIAEAREEAARVLEGAQAEAQSTLSQAQEAARQVREEAEQEANEKVSRLGEHKERLEREVQSLTALLEGERERLTQSLNAALRFVGETLALSEEMSQVAAASRGPAPQQPGRLEDRAPELDLGDFEEALPEEPAPGLGHGAGAEGGHSHLEPERVEAPAAAEPADPDEELWARWAKGAGIGDEPEGEARPVENRLGAERPWGNWTA